MTDSLSNKAIDRAATDLRDWYASPAADVHQGLVRSVGVVWAYRASFSYPLKKVTVTMRQFVRRESSEVIVSSRLKRLPTILEKLGRHPHMKITRMQDIGGCRAILPGGMDEVYGVLRRVKKNWDVREVYDYVEQPKPRTGYRAVHVVVARDGRLVEVQLRTPTQHRWALEIERTGSRLNLPGLKDGYGPVELVRYFELASHVLGMQDLGQVADDEVEREFRELRVQVRPYFTANP